MNKLSTFVRRGAVVTVGTVALLVSGAVAALATGTTGPADVVGAASSSLKDDLFAVLTTALPYAVAIIAVVFGFRLALRFFKRA